MSDISDFLLSIIIVLLINFLYRRSQEGDATTKPKRSSKTKQKSGTKVLESAQKKPSLTDVVVPKSPEVPAVPKEVPQLPLQEENKSLVVPKSPEVPVVPKEVPQLPLQEENKLQEEKQRSPEPVVPMEVDKVAVVLPKAARGIDYNEENVRSTFLDKNLRSRQGGFRKRNPEDAPRSTFVGETRKRKNRKSREIIKIPSDGALNPTQRDENNPMQAMGGNLQKSPSGEALNRTQNEGHIPTPDNIGNLTKTPIDGILNPTQNEENIPTPTGGRNVPTAVSEDSINRTQQDGNTPVFTPGKTGTSGEDYQVRSVGIDSAYINRHLRNEHRHQGATAVKKGIYMG